jgi:hypothetical protein
MTRRLLNLLTLLSLLALCCLAYVYAWAVAEGMGMGEYSRQWRTEHTTYWINCRADGELRFTTGRRIPRGQQVAYPTSREASDSWSDRVGFAGIRVGRSDRPDKTERSVRWQFDWIAVPIVYLLLPASVLPSFRMTRYLRRRRVGAVKVKE